MVNLEDCIGSWQLLPQRARSLPEISLKADHDTAKPSSATAPRSTVSRKLAAMRLRLDSLLQSACCQWGLIIVVVREGSAFLYSLRCYRRH